MVPVSRRCGHVTNPGITSMEPDGKRGRPAHGPGLGRKKPVFSMRCTAEGIAFLRRHAVLTCGYSSVAAWCEAGAAGFKSPVKQLITKKTSGR